MTSTGDARPVAQYARVPGVQIAPMGALWAAFSPLSGETALINDEAAAVLDVLLAGPHDSAGVAQALAADCDLAPSALCETIEACWPRLAQAGLVTRLPLRRP